MPAKVQGNLNDTKWVWGFFDKTLGVNVKDEKGKEVRTNFEPEDDKLRWFTEKRDKYRAFNVPDEKEAPESDEQEKINEENNADNKQRKNLKFQQDYQSEAQSKKSKTTSKTMTT